MTGCGRFRPFPLRRAKKCFALAHTFHTTGSTSLLLDSLCVVKPPETRSSDKREGPRERPGPGPDRDQDSKAEAEEKRNKRSNRGVSGESRG